jgi:hypothetical protein
VQEVSIGMRRGAAEVLGQQPLLLLSYVPHIVHQVGGFNVEHPNVFVTNGHPGQKIRIIAVVRDDES